MEISKNNLNIEKIIKLLNLTNSDNDFEALNSIRKANAMIQKYKYSWEKIIQVQLTKSQPEDPEDSNETDDLFNIIFNNSNKFSDKTFDFVNSLYKCWIEKEYLTIKQFEALEKIANQFKFR